MKSHDAVIINQNTCFGCGACIMSCPVNAINLIKRIAIVSSPKCTACDLCIFMCPVQAISPDE